MNISYYILKEGKEVPSTEDEWEKFMYGEERFIAVDHGDGIRVSTIFLGLDHSYGGPVPILYETMIFGSDKHNGYQERYSTLEEAKAGHQKALELIKNK